jgi:flagellar assembly factor FliW
MKPQTSLKTYLEVTCLQINTKNFGEIEIGDSQVIHFDEGLPGFEEEKEFVLLNNYDTEDPVPFMWLQAANNPDLALVVAIPFFLKPDYEVEIPEDVVKTLDIQSPEDVGVYSVVKIEEKVEDMTFNLMSPIVINAKNRKASQVIQDHTDWRVDEKYVKA